MTRVRHEQLQKLARLARLKADQELARFATASAEVTAAEARVGALEAELIAAAEGAAFWANDMIAGPGSGDLPGPNDRGCRAAPTDAALPARSADNGPGPSPARAGPDAATRSCAPPGQGLQADTLIKARLAHALTRQVALDREDASAARARLQPGFDAARQAAILAFGKADVMERLQKDLALDRKRRR